MAKIIDLNKSVFELTSQYPEIIDIMKKNGFSEITKPSMLHSAGKIMTIPKGAAIKKISLKKIEEDLVKAGFDGDWADDAKVAVKVAKMKAALANAKVSVKTDEVKSPVVGNAAQPVNPSAPMSRTAMLKSYLKRIGAGEDPESVKADFVANFKEIDAAEIMKAEQEMMSDGTPITEVQKLCDIHSALFHGATTEEKIANAEAAAMASLKKQKEAEDAEIAGEAADKAADKVADKAADEVADEAAGDASGEDEGKNAPVTGLEQISLFEDPELQAAKAKALKLAAENQDGRSRAAARKAAAREMSARYGHPLYLFTKENEAFTALLEEEKKITAAGEDAGEILNKMRDISIHYAKKGDLLYPLLKVKYDVSGPSDVMWTVDDEIRDEMSALAKNENHDAEWNARLEKVLTRAEEMIYKEVNILFPICAQNFTEEEWHQIYEGSLDYLDCLGVQKIVWDEAENAPKKELLPMDGEIVMPGGHMNLAQLTALLNTLPIEITFVDDKNINRFFNEGPKVFKRAGMAIDREVFSCHPPKVEAMVRSIFQDFRDGKRDSVPIWMEKVGKPFLVTYFAVRDKDKNYLGTVEVVQDMSAAKEHFLSQN